LEERFIHDKHSKFTAEAQAPPKKSSLQADSALLAVPAVLPTEQQGFRKVKPRQFPISTLVERNFRRAHWRLNDDMATRGGARSSLPLYCELRLRPISVSRPAFMWIVILHDAHFAFDDCQSQYIESRELNNCQLS
jgi:hypothetical protein